MQSSTTNQKTRRQLTSDRLPLAVYREVAAHLRQVEGVDTSLIMRSIEHDPKAKFDYYQSQVAAIEISYLEEITETDKQRISEILDYYAQRYSPWENIEVEEVEDFARPS
ncbi:MAG: hypothetical protein RLZZ574_971 [Cyanobacteriota bacterium]